MSEKRRLHAKVGFDHLSHVWVVTLRIRTVRGDEFFFGQRVFHAWPRALDWAIRRTHA